MPRVTKATLALTCALVFGLTGLPAQGDPGSNPSAKDCLGVERGERNRNGGDREHGQFGQEQSAFVQTLNAAGEPYGQFLKDWKAANCP